MSDIKEHLRILKTCAPGSTDWITNMLAIGQYHAQELAEAFELHLRYKSVLLKDGIKAAEAIFVHSETALISSLAMRCRPAVAHYMRTQERAAMSKALSPAAKEAAEKEAAWQGKLLDEIDNLIGARQVPPHRSGGGHG